MNSIEKMISSYLAIKDNRNIIISVLASVVAMGTITGVATSSVVPVIAAVSGAITGAFAAYTAHRSQKATAQDFLMQQYLGLIGTLQSEVARLNAENTNQRLMMDKQEEQIKHMKVTLDSLQVQVTEVKESVA